MLKIGFVVTPDFPISSLAPLSVFEFANLGANKQRYELHMLSERGGPVAAYGGALVNTRTFADTRFDTVIIGGNTRVTATTPAMSGFIANATKSARRISSICTGVFALAESGLLRGRRVTTHWLFTAEFRSRFPDVKMEENRIFVVDGSFWTAAGNSAGIDLALGMLENDFGVDASRSVAKIMVVDHQRAGGQPQQSALLDMDAKTDRIQNSLAFARGNLQASLSVEHLAHVAGLGPRQFSRAFRTQTGTSPAKAIESLRIEAARVMLAQSAHSIGVIASQTGFGDEERMRRAFLRVVGQSPQAIRRHAHAE
jgi:transcriptional regulator GlxA family with amidase domain